jgi:hypothetical protein
MEDAENVPGTWGFGTGSETVIGIQIKLFKL